MKHLKLLNIHAGSLILDGRLFRKGDEIRVCGESYEGKGLSSKTITVQGTFLLGVGGFWKGGYTPPRITIKDKYSDSLYLILADSIYSIRRISGEELYLKGCDNMMSEETLESFMEAHPATGYRLDFQIYDEF